MSLLSFSLGVAVGFAMILLWHAIQFVADLRAIRRVSELTASVQATADSAAMNAVRLCKQRLRGQKNPNPEWIRPLVDELPKLVHEIAAIYYPDSPKPILAPGVSHFTAAIQLAAKDVTEFLQTRRMGRLINISAHSALRGWERAHGIVQNPKVQRVSKWFSRLKPIWQAIRWKSPVTWISIGFQNVAVRALQPAIVDIVAQRVIELYSGRVIKK
jgi:hypothetical protein